jgi:CRP-like cAMP-binding protein
LNSQEFFGERDFFDSLRRSAAAVANEDCLLLSMPKSKLEDTFYFKKTHCCSVLLAFLENTCEQWRIMFGGF